MEQHKEDIGTRKDLVLYRLQTARTALKSVMPVIMMISCDPKGPSF